MAEALTSYLALLILAMIVMIMVGITVVVTVGAATAVAIIILTYGPPIIIKICNWISSKLWRP